MKNGGWPFRTAPAEGKGYPLSICPGIRWGKPGSHSAWPFRSLRLPQPVKDLCQAEPVFLFEGVQFYCLIEKFQRFYQVDVTDLQLVEYPQPVVRIRIGRSELSGPEEDFGRSSWAIGEGTLP